MDISRDEFNRFVDGGTRQVRELIDDSLRSEQLADDKLISAQLPRPVVVVVDAALLPRVLLPLALTVVAPVAPPAEDTLVQL